MKIESEQNEISPAEREYGLLRRLEEELIAVGRAVEALKEPRRLKEGVPGNREEEDRVAAELVAVIDAWERIKKDMEELIRTETE